MTSIQMTRLINSGSTGVDARSIIKKHQETTTTWKSMGKDEKKNLLHFMHELHKPIFNDNLKVDTKNWKMFLEQTTGLSQISDPIFETISGIDFIIFESSINKDLKQQQKKLLKEKAIIPIKEDNKLRFYLPCICSWDNKTNQIRIDLNNYRKEINKIDFEKVINGIINYPECVLLAAAKKGLPLHYLKKSSDSLFRSIRLKKNQTDPVKKNVLGRFMKSSSFLRAFPLKEQRKARQELADKFSQQQNKYKDPYWGAVHAISDVYLPLFNESIKECIDILFSNHQDVDSTTLTAPIL